MSEEGKGNIVEMPMSEATAQENIEEQRKATPQEAAAYENGQGAVALAVFQQIAPVVSRVFGVSILVLPQSGQLNDLDEVTLRRISDIMSRIPEEKRMGWRLLASAPANVVS